MHWFEFSCLLYVRFVWSSFRFKMHFKIELRRGTEGKKKNLPFEMLLLEDGPTRWLLIWTYVIFKNENNIAYFG